MAPFKFKSSIKIKGKKYKIRQVDTVPPADRNNPDLSEELHGLFDPDLATIFILKSLDIETKKRVYMHEIFHAILHECHIQIDLAIEEAIVDSLSTELVSKFYLQPK